MRPDGSRRSAVTCRAAARASSVARAGSPAEAEDLAFGAGADEQAARRLDQRDRTAQSSPVSHSVSHRPSGRMR